MKRIWFGVIFLLFCTAACITEQIYIDNMYNDMISKVNAIQDEIDTKSTKEMTDSINSLQKTWHKNKNFLFSFVDSNVLNEVDVAIDALSSSDIDEIKYALAEARALITSFYQGQKVNIANIL